MSGGAGAVADRLTAWWARERRALEAQQGRSARTVRWLLARPGVVLLPPAVLSPGLFGAAIPGGDAQWFREAGLSLLGPDALDVFSAAGLQIGPLYLLLVGLLASGAQALGLPVLFTVAALQSAGLLAYALYVSGRWARAFGTSPLRARWGVGVPLVFLGPLSESIGNGHPEELGLGLMLAHLVLLAREGRAAGAGALLGAAVGIKLWAILGAPLVLLSRRWRTVLVSGVVTLACTLTAYVPFAALGEMNTFEFTWGGGPAPFGLEIPEAALGGWGFRVAQAVLVVLSVALVAWRWPGSGLGAVMTLVAVRVVLDPLLQMYYTIPFIVLVLIWLWTSGAVRGAHALGFSALVLVAMLAPYLVDRTTRVMATHVLLVGVAAAVVRLDHRRHPPPTRPDRPTPPEDGVGDPILGSAPGAHPAGQRHPTRS